MGLFPDTNWATSVFAIDRSEYIRNTCVDGKKDGRFKLADKHGSKSFDQGMLDLAGNGSLQMALRVESIISKLKLSKSG